LPCSRGERLIPKIGEILMKKQIGIIVFFCAALVTLPGVFAADGSEISLAVLVPEGKGLAADQSYLPDMVQGVFVSGLAKYSKIRVLDRQNLEKVLKETESGIYQDEANLLQFGQTANVNHVLTGAITKTSSGFALQVQIVPASADAGALTRASYSGNCTVAELDNFTAINKATLELLTQLNIDIPAHARQELTGAASAQAVSGQTALARGITAQKSGTVVEAMSYYYEAAKFDPGLAEAASRGSVLSADISSGNIGENIRNDIQLRNAWKKTIDEAAAFFKEHPPFEIIYNPALKQGRINYDTETVALSFDMLLISATDFKIINDIEQGLEKTGKRREWGIGVDSIFSAMPPRFDIDAVLIDERGETIGRASGRFNTGTGVRIQSRFSQQRHTVTFQNVDANKISDALTVSIVSVNGMDAKTAGERGYIGISPENFLLSDRGDSVKFTDSFSVTWLFGGITILGYHGTEKNLVIPSKISRWPVVSLGENSFSRIELSVVTIPDGVTFIGSYAFFGNRLTSVTIPGSVTSIGSYAFSGNRLTSVTIPGGVTSIGSSAFRDNQLTSVTIPGSVTSIGSYAFCGNRLTSVTIVTNPNNAVSIGEAAFSANPLVSVTLPANVSMMTYTSGGIDLTHDLRSFYNENGKKAGTYTHTSSRTWTYRP
jgi:TolB-like protein